MKTYDAIKGAITICFLLFAMILPAQENAKLDKKNGFKDFTFGDSQNMYNGKLVKVFDNTYQFTGDTPNSIFGWRWSDLFLNFYKNRLGSIEVFWLDSGEIYPYLLEDLEKIFGISTTASSLAMQKGEVNLYNKWEGKNVWMTLRRYNPTQDLPCPDCTISLIIRRDDIETQALEDDF